MWEGKWQIENKNSNFFWLILMHMLHIPLIGLNKKGLIIVKDKGRFINLTFCCRSLVTIRLYVTCAFD